MTARVSVAAIRDHAERAESERERTTLKFQEQIAEEVSAVSEQIAEVSDKLDRVIACLARMAEYSEDEHKKHQHTLDQLRGEVGVYYGAAQSGILAAERATKIAMGALDAVQSHRAQARERPTDPDLRKYSSRPPPGAK